MAYWRKIREWLLTKGFGADTGKRLLALIRSSESPVGFLLMAGAGLMLVLVLNLGPDENAAATEDDAGTEMTADMEASGNALADTAPEEGPGDSPEDSAETVDAAHTSDAAVGDSTDTRTETLRLKRRETLSGLLKRARIDTGNSAEAIAELRKVTNLRQLRAGQQLHLTRSAGDAAKIERLTLRDSFAATAVVEAGPDGYSAKRTTIPTVALTQLVEGTIDDNLYMSAKRAGLPDKVIVELIHLMSFDVDFERDIRDGDRFRVYYERTYAPTLNEAEDGRILELQLALNRGDFEATYFEDADGHGDYYDADGKSARRALMKTPLDVAVMTSSFGSRKHPVLGYTRMHKGVDFRASVGTPIMAAGDGVIERASRWGSFGNYIRIRHNGTYSTAYAHLSRYGKGIHAGAHVRQGQIIGYSGATGRVKGPHLHYEVLVSGKQVNPMTLKLPSGKSLKGKTLATYEAARQSTLADISHIEWSQKTLLAEADADAAQKANLKAASQPGAVVPAAATPANTPLDDSGAHARLTTEP